MTWLDVPANTPDTVQQSTSDPQPAYARGHGVATRRRGWRTKPPGLRFIRADLMAKQATTKWNLRALMFDRGMFKTNDIHEPLREHGIDISREQLFRLVTRPPVRLRVDIIGALCSILECTPNDLFTIEVHDDALSARKSTGTEGRAPRVDVAPIRLDVTTRG